MSGSLDEDVGKRSRRWKEEIRATGEVSRIFTLADGLIERMDLPQREASPASLSPAFATH